MKFIRGDKVLLMNGMEATILGAEDFDGYEYNRPNEKWELVKADSKQFWVGSQWLRPIPKDNV